MTDAPDIESLRQQKYNYVVTRDGEDYTVVISELCLIATGTDLQECIAKVDQDREEMFDTFVSMGRGDSLPLPRSQQSSETSGRERQTLTQFVVRSSILAFIIVLGMGFFGLVISARLEPYFHYTYVRDVVSKVAIAIVDDLSTERGEDWATGMKNLRKARAKLREIEEILNEKSNE